MVFKGMVNEFGAVRLDYLTTWNYGYGFVLDALQEIISTDLKENTEGLWFSEKEEASGNVIEELMENNLKVRRCPSVLQEHDIVSVSGHSRIMDADIRIVFFKGLGGVRIYLKDKKLIRKKGKNAFDKYMDSLEIHAYCTAAVRDALTAQAQEEDPVTLSFDTDAE